MESLWRDVRVALRTWRKRPGFTALIIITLAAGIGAHAVVFSLVDRVLLRALPYPEPERLAVLRTELVETGDVAAKSSGPEMMDVRGESDLFEEVGAIWARPAALTDDRAEPEEIEMGFVTAGFLSVLGAPPALGRDVLPQEDLPNAPPVVVLSHELWQRRYGGDPAILGTTMEMDGEPHFVVGVMPPGFRLLLPPDAGVPSLLEAFVPWGGGYEDLSRSFRVLTVVARLSERKGFSDAEARLSTLARRVVSDHPEDYALSGLKFHLSPLHRAVTESLRPALLVLWSTVGFALFIACANAANLLLVRATSQEHEMAVRRALGASRSRLLRQSLTEGVMLSAGGGALGALVTDWGVTLLPRISPDDIPRFSDMALDGRTLAVVMVTSVLAGIGLGVVSALHLSRTGGAADLRSRWDSESGRSRVRRVLVAAQIALSLILLVGGGLLLRSFRALSRVELGYRTADVTTLKLSLIDSSYPYSDPEKIARFYRNLIERISELPGVESAGATTELPLDRVAFRLRPYAYESDRGLVEWDTVLADYRTATPGWLEALGATLLEGRLLDWTDDLEHPTVVVVDELLARTAWPGESAVGKRLQVEVFRRGRFQRTWSEVVGVVAHVRHHPATVGEGQIFLPHQQSPQRTMTLAIRSRLPLDGLASAVQELVAEQDASQPIHSVRPMEDYRAEALGTHRFVLSSLGGFASLALLLAFLGIYGVMAFAISRRTREIGLRMALGAEPRRILLQVLREGLVLVGPGLALGVAGALLLSRFLSSLLFGITSTDPLTFAATALLLAAVAIAACYVPGRRASSLSPLQALRME